jgi:hypothetical protein
MTFRSLDIDLVLRQMTVVAVAAVVAVDALALPLALALVVHPGDDGCTK